MNDEIKEILDSLNKIAKAEYYPENLLTFRECIMLLEYIENLQQRNEKAIEYINQHTISDNVWFKDLRKGIILFEDGVEELLNILNGGDEE